MLMPHAARFRTLSIVADTLENIHAMILCWFDHGAPGSVTELSVSTWNGYARLLPSDVHEKHSREAIDNFLRPINVLQLKNAYLDWDSAAYEGLSSLRLEFKATIKVAHLAKILDVSPRLNSLILRQIRLGELNEPVFDPRSLPHLHTLYVDDLTPESMQRLLRLIEPGPYTVHLNFSARSLPPDESGGPMNIDSLGPVFPLLHSFNVISLSLERRCMPDSLSIFLQSLSHLRTLYLHDTDGLYDTATLNAMIKSSAVQEPAAGNGSTAASLYAIHIAGIVRDANAFKAMVSSYRLKQLSLVGSVDELDELRNSSDNGDTDVVGPTEELCTWASNHVPDFLRCNIGEMALHAARLRPFLWRLW
ncbi:hypothetical protein FRC09_019640 [Ceratobasidium sp. 395]|nr:hypothetical protein FRC09_019640 [Ceratobasidium sp. 395]